MFWNFAETNETIQNILRQLHLIFLVKYNLSRLTRNQTQGFSKKKSWLLCVNDHCARSVVVPKNFFTEVTMWFFLEQDIENPPPHIVLWSCDQKCSENCVENRTTFEGQEEVGSNLIWKMEQKIQENCAYLIIPWMQCYCLTNCINQIIEGVRRACIRRACVRPPRVEVQKLFYGCHEIRLNQVLVST